MTLAKLLRESPCFMTIQPSLRVRWTKPRWPFAKLVTPRKQTASRASCANVIRITSAGEPFKMCMQRRVYRKGSLLRLETPDNTRDEQRGVLGSALVEETFVLRCLSAR